MRTNPASELHEERRKFEELAYAHPVVPMCGRPPHDQPMPPVAAKAEPRETKSTGRMI